MAVSKVDQSGFGVNPTVRTEGRADPYAPIAGAAGAAVSGASSFQKLRVAAQEDEDKAALMGARSDALGLLTGFFDQANEAAVLNDVDQLAALYVGGNPDELVGAGRAQYESIREQANVMRDRGQTSAFAELVRRRRVNELARTYAPLGLDEDIFKAAKEMEISEASVNEIEEQAEFVQKQMREQLKASGVVIPASWTPSDITLQYQQAFGDSLQVISDYQRQVNLIEGDSNLRVAGKRNREIKQFEQGGVGKAVVESLAANTLVALNKNKGNPLAQQQALSDFATQVNLEAGKFGWSRESEQWKQWVQPMIEAIDAAAGGDAKALARLETLSGTQSTMARLGLQTMVPNFNLLQAVENTLPNLTRTIPGATALFGVGSNGGFIDDIVKGVSQLRAGEMSYNPQVAPTMSRAPTETGTEYGARLRRIGTQAYQAVERAKTPDEASAVALAIGENLNVAASATNPDERQVVLNELLRSATSKNFPSITATEQWQQVYLNHSDMLATYTEQVAGFVVDELGSEGLSVRDDGYLAGPPSPALAAFNRLINLHALSTGTPRKQLAESLLQAMQE